METTRMWTHILIDVPVLSGKRGTSAEINFSVDLSLNEKGYCLQLWDAAQGIEINKYCTSNQVKSNQVNYLQK